MSVTFCEPVSSGAMIAAALSGFAASTNMIQTLRPLGFQVGSAVQVNESGLTYHWVAFGNVATAVELMSFEAVPFDSAVELRWQTGSELWNLGFHLYRSSSAEGPYARAA